MVKWQHFLNQTSTEPEKKILESLKDLKSADFIELAVRTDLEEDEIRAALTSLERKRLVTVINKGQVLKEMVTLKADLLRASA